MLLICIKICYKLLYVVFSSDKTSIWLKLHQFISLVEKAGKTELNDINLSLHHENTPI